MALQDELAGIGVFALVAFQAASTAGAGESPPLPAIVSSKAKSGPSGRRSGEGGPAGCSGGRAGLGSAVLLERGEFIGCSGCQLVPNVSWGSTSAKVRFASFGSAPPYTARAGKRSFPKAHDQAEPGHEGARVRKSLVRKSVAAEVAAGRFGDGAEALEPHEFLPPGERDDPGRAAAVLGDDQFGLAGPIAGIVGVGPMQEEDQVGVLLDRPAFAEVGEARAVSLPAARRRG